jgi:hypothetical protein
MTSQSKLDANKRWRAANPEKYRESVMRAQAKKKAEDPEAWRKHHREYQAARRAANPEPHRKHVRNWKTKHPERHAAGIRKQVLRRKGLTSVEFDALLKKQRGRCAICRCKEPGGKGTWKIDHCHKTNKVRGLLCNGCNTGLGMLRDNPKIIEAAIQYLERREA